MKKRLLALLLCCAMMFALAGCVARTETETGTESPSQAAAQSSDGTANPVETHYQRPAAETLENEVEFAFKVVHSDGSEFTTYVTTDQAYLGYALLEDGLIGGIVGPYGLYVKTVDNERANEENEEWWCLTKNGESVNTGVDSTPVEADAEYVFTFTVGY